MSIDPQNIELDARQRADLAALAERVGKPWTAVFSEALEAYRHKAAANGHADESVLEAASRLGLVGCVRSGIPDLTTNPIHMEGFGSDDR
ncbi:MAG: hypothetical protein M3552_14055 [Planctomycetota bacterium]|nr:hypothetical protein [Planctomycetaceae bacterium]MDQ3331756.1 hypothetical protein [Planctomycetota bacterium]